MKVYALVSNYCDGYDEWEHIIDLYLDFDDALTDQLTLEETNTDSSQSWTVREMEVK